MKNVEVKVETSEKEIIVREGAAANVYDPETVSVSGTIHAPADFAEKRKSKIEPLKTNVVADYTKKTIVLTVNEDSKFKTTITGTLDDFPELKDMSINGKKTFSHRELLDLIKFKGSYFKNKEQHVKLLTDLKNFDAKVNQEFQNANDFKGAQATKRIVDIKTNIGLEFILAIPVFTGGEVISFMVDICVDINNGGVIFWLESVELHDLQTKTIEEEFKTQLARLGEYIIIKKW